MKVELKSISHSEALSHETNAFSAKVYVNGKHVGQAENSGHGGPTSVTVVWKGKIDSETGFPVHSESDKQAVKELHAWAEENHKYGIEGLIDDLLFDELYWRDFQKLKRTRLLYLKEGKVWSCERGKIPSEYIKSGKAEKLLNNTSWWKPDYVFLNNVKKPEFTEKYLKAFVE
jgi:hypothetical protein